MHNDRVQAIAGVVPPSVEEAVIMQVWPSISASAVGRFLGVLYQWPLLLRMVIVLATLPLVILLYALPIHRLVRYTLTTRRVIIQKGLRSRPAKDLSLEEIEEVRVVQRPGQAFYRAGDLELTQNGKVGLLLPGVACPEPFRRNILKARDAYVKVMQVHRARQPAVAGEPAAV